MNRAAFTAGALARRLPSTHLPRAAALLSAAARPSRAASRAYSQMRRPPANMGIVIVPQQQAYIVERFGKYLRTLEPGFHLLIPGVDRIAYNLSLKETPLVVAGQAAVTKDNVALHVDGVLFVKVRDPVLAAYGVEDPYQAVVQLAQTTMRSELGKRSLDLVFQERDSLNAAIVTAINQAAVHWGTEVLRYEIRDISPPASVKAAMDMQAEAERRKRAEILESEGRREAAINNAEGERKSVMLAAEAEASAIMARARANAAAIELLANAVQKPAAREALSLRLGEQYISAFGNLAKKGTTLVIPANASDASSMIAQAVATFETVRNRVPWTAPTVAGGPSVLDEMEAETALAALEEAEAAAKAGAHSADSHAAEAPHTPSHSGAAPGGGAGSFVPKPI